MLTSVRTIVLVTLNDLLVLRHGEAARCPSKWRSTGPMTPVARVDGMERMELGGLHSGESVASAALMAADRARMLGFQPGAEDAWFSARC